MLRNPQAKLGENLKKCLENFIDLSSEKASSNSQKNLTLASSDKGHTAPHPSSEILFLEDKMDLLKNISISCLIGIIMCSGAAVGIFVATLGLCGLMILGSDMQFIK